MATLTANEVTQNFTKGLSGSVLTGTSKIDEAIKNSTKFNSLQDVVTKMIADCRAAGNAETFLRDYCGITNENNGTFNSAYGFDLNGKTYEELLPQNSTATYPTETTFNKRGLIVTVPEESTLTEQQKLLIKGAYSWWIENAVKLVEETYNVDFDGEKIQFGFKYDEKSGSIATTNNNGIFLNMASSVKDITEDTLKNYSPYGIASALAHEMTHVAQYKFNMPDYINDGTPKYLDEGMADLTVGRFFIDDIKELSGNADILAKYVDTNNANYTSDSKAYEAGYLFWRYLMKQTADSYDGVTDYSRPTFNGTDSDDEGYAGYVHAGNGSNYLLGGGNDSLYIHGDNISVNGGSGNEYIYIGNDGKGTIVGGAGNDSIYNHGATAKVDSGEDNDYISNFASNVTITSGAGDDTVYLGSEGYNLFNYNNGDGKDRVYNLTSNDTVKINDGSFSTVKSGYNVIVQVGNDEVTLFGAADKNLNIVGQSASVTVGTKAHAYNGGNKTITDYKEGEIIQLYSDYQGIGLEGNSFFVKSSSGQLEIKNARNKFIGYSAGDGEVAVYSYVAGSSGAIDGRDKSEIEMMIGADNLSNQIYAGNGGSSLWGGVGGADTLTGGDGYDEFFFTVGSGVDVIQNSASNDLINLLGISLDQITYADIGDSIVSVGFSDGGSLKIESNSRVGYKVGNAVYAVNPFTKQWYEK